MTPVIFDAGYGIMSAMIRERVVQWADRFIRLPVAGLDISDRSIKYVKFSPVRRGVIESFGEHAVAEGIIVEGRIERMLDFIAALREVRALLGSRWRLMGAAASLPEEKSFLRLVQVPNVKPEEIAAALRWQIEGQIPLPAEDLAYDYQVIEPLIQGVDHRDVVITAYPKGVVDSYVRALKEAGFQPVALELESQAIARAALGVAPAYERLVQHSMSDKSPEGAIVVDMGRNRTSIAVSAAGSVLYTVTVPVGGRALEQAIAGALGVSADEAVSIKKEQGLARDAHEGKLFASLSPLADMLAGELARTIAYYEDHIAHIHGGSRDIKRMLLSGGDANLPGLDTYLASRIRIPVSAADPFHGMERATPYPIPEIPKNESLAFAAAIGLARRGQIEK